MGQMAPMLSYASWGGARLRVEGADEGVALPEQKEVQQGRLAHLPRRWGVRSSGSILRGGEM
jgi:hypothetical protein